MATKDPVINTDETEEHDDATSCCICTDVYTDPKLLPCTHTFCMKCLRETGLKSKREPGDEMPCPICRRLFKIPPEGFHGLHTNFFIEKLIKVENLLNQSVVTKDICDACQEENEEQKSEHTSAADAYCLECKQKLCEECCKHHRKVKLTKNHKLVPIKELHTISESVMSDLVPYVCEIHEERVLDVYCVKCNVVVCAICFIDDHKNHEGSHVAKFVTGFRQQIEIHRNLLIDCSSQAQRKKSQLMRAKEDMQRKVEILQADIAKRAVEIKQFADTHANSILQSLGVLQRNELKHFEVATGEIDDYLSVLDSFKDSCQRVMAQGSPCHICRSTVNISARAIELQHQCQSLVEQEIQSFNVCFKASDLEEFMKNEGGNLIGEIEKEHVSKPNECSKQTQTTIKTIEANAEKLKQDLDKEKTANEALQSEVKNLLQELNNEKRSNKTLQTDLDILKQTIVTERKSAEEKLTKTKEEFQNVIFKLESNLANEKKEMEQLIVKAKEEEKKKQAVPKYGYHFSRENYFLIDQNDGTVTYDPPAGYGDRDSTVMAKLPFTEDCPFFEIEIVNRGVIGAISVGAARKDLPIGRHPGWEPQSYGYHADDGCLFANGNAKGTKRPKVCASGDKMGCGVEFHGGRIKNVYFTKNGTRVHEYSSNVANPSSGLFPTIGMDHSGDKVRLISKESWRFSDQPCS